MIRAIAGGGGVRVGELDGDVAARRRLRKSNVIVVPWATASRIGVRCIGRRAVGRWIAPAARQRAHRRAARQRDRETSAKATAHGTSRCSEERSSHSYLQIDSRGERVELTSTFRQQQDIAAASTPKNDG